MRTQTADGAAPSWIFPRVGEAHPSTQREADELAKQLAAEWDASAAELLARLLPTTSLDRPAVSKWRRSPRVEDIVLAEDWSSLVRHDWRHVANWRERDLATWLNRLISERVAVKARAHPRRASGSQGPTPREVAQAMFFIGR